MVSDDTAQLVPGMFILRELDLVRVKGRKQALRIHELLATAGASLPEKQKEMLELYAAGLAAYRERRWARRWRSSGNASLWPQDGPPA